MFRIDTSQSIYESGNPLGYPNVLHESPILLSGEHCHEIDWRFPTGVSRIKDTGISLNDHLIKKGAVPIENRVAQVAFGANRDLVNIAWKLKNYSDASGRTVSEDVIVLPSLIHDADVVACNIGYWGYMYAALLMHRRSKVERPYLKGVSAPVAILLLDERQMNVMHQSEGVIKHSLAKRPMVNCDVAIIDAELPGKFSVSAQLYSLSLPFLSFDGARPVAFDAVNAQGRNGRYPAMGQVEMLANIIKRMGLDTPVDKVVSIIQAGAHARKNGIPVDSARDLYEQIRELIITKLPLQDADGVIRRGCESIDNLLPPSAAWKFQDTLGEQNQSVAV